LQSGLSVLSEGKAGSAATSCPDHWSGKKKRKGPPFCFFAPGKGKFFPFSVKGEGEGKRFKCQLSPLRKGEEEKASPVASQIIEGKKRKKKGVFIIGFPSWGKRGKRYVANMRNSDPGKKKKKKKKETTPAGRLTHRRVVR